MLADFLSPEEQKQIAQSITDAERLTSGEICVHVTPHTHGNTLRRARLTFNRLRLFCTARRNAVLIFIAYLDRRVAILGDTGINEKVEPDFWNQATRLLTSHLAEHRNAQGICETVAMIGNQLSEIFPATRHDTNEIGNEVTYED